VTVGELCNMIGEYMATTGTNRLPTSARLQMVNLAQKWLARQFDWSWFGADFQGTSMPFTWQRVQLPTNFLRPVRIYYQDPDTGIDVELTGSGRFMDITELDLLYPGQNQTVTINGSPTTVYAPVSGKPVACALWQNGIELRPRFANGGSIRMRYYALPADFAAANETSSPFLNAAWDAILFTALARFAPPYMMEDARMASWNEQMRQAIQTVNTSQRAAQGRGARPVARRPGLVIPRLEGVEA